ncbi:MAG: T9SS type B sorting domain-containing protein, partial [Cytophagaceae bacterium]
TNTAIVVPATLTMPLCNGTATGIITFNPSGGVGPYQYSANGGTTFQASNTFTAQTAGSHTFRIRDAVGCIRDTTVILAQPTALVSSSVSTAPTGCGNTDGVIRVTASGATPAYSYTIAGPTVNTTGATTGIFTGLGTGAYTLTTTDAMGCTSVSNATVVLVDNMFLNAGNDTTICVEQTLTFNPQTNAGTNVFLWTTNNTAVGAITNANTANASITPTDTASYHLHAEWGACSREDDIIVNVLHKPVPNAGKDTAICNISYAILRGSASNLSGTVNYSWSPAANIENPDQPVTRVFPPGNNTTYTYTLTVTDNYGCNFSVTDDVKVRVQPPVPAFAGNDTTVVKGVPHQLFGSGGTEYLWSPSANLNSPFNANPLATLQNDTKFILKVTDVAGCIGYDTVFVKVYEGPTYYMPNAFTPNGDGLNDVFRPIPVGISNTQYFRIFNRYGELMFETNQWLKGWDGSYRGKQQPMGVYVWIIKGVDRNGKNVEMKGTVMLTH